MAESSDLDATCSTTSCTFDGMVTFGPGTTVSLTGMFGVDGVDAAVSSSIASAWVVLRKDQIAMTQTTLFFQQTTCINSSGFTVNAQLTNCYQTVTAVLGTTNVDVSVGIGSINFPVISISPLDALIPGASLHKKAWKKFKSWF